MNEQGRGLIQRNFASHPIGYCAAPFPFPPMADSEIDDRLEVLEREKATLIDIRNISGPDGGPIPSLNQGGSSLCWAHSTVTSVLLMRAKAGLPYVPLNAFGLALQINGFRPNQGGWCQQSVEGAVERGIPSMKTWPFQSTSRSNITPAMKAEQNLYRITEWWDGGDDPRLWWTALALGFAPVSDYNDWGHSVCAVFGNRKKQTATIMNSWADTWGKSGLGPPQSRTPHPQNWMVPRVVTA